MKNKNTVIIIIGIILFMISLFIDNNIAFFIFSIKNPFFDAIFKWFSFLNVFAILILITTLFLFEERKREWVFPLWLSFLFSVIISFAIKIIIARPRPSLDLYYPIINMISYSFPSMHAMVAFAALPILNKEFSKLRWFWILVATMVALSRIYLNFHFLSDVIFGSFLGYFIGVFIIYIEKKHKPFKFLQ